MSDFGLNKVENEGENTHHLLRLPHFQGQIVRNHQSDQPNRQLRRQGQGWPRPQHPARNRGTPQENHQGPEQSHQDFGGKNQRFLYRFENSLQEIRQEHWDGRPPTKKQLWPGGVPDGVWEELVEGSQLFLRQLKAASPAALLRHNRIDVREIRAIQINGVMFRRGYLPDNPLHPHFKISGQGRQKPLQIFPADAAPNRH